MEWTWLLVFIGLMFVMHRFGMGCCGGHGHGGHGNEEDKGRKSELGHEVTDTKDNSSRMTAKSGDMRA